MKETNNKEDQGSNPFEDAEVIFQYTRKQAIEDRVKLLSDRQGQLLVKRSDLEARLAVETGFAIYGHHLEVYGICPVCRAAREDDHAQ